MGQPEVIPVNSPHRPNFGNRSQYRIGTRKEETKTQCQTGQVQRLVCCLTVAANALGPHFSPGRLGVENALMQPVDGVQRLAIFVYLE